MLAVKILSVVLGVFFIITGAMKVIGTEHMVIEFKKFKYPQWLRVVAGLVELVGAPLMVLAFKWPVLAALGALIILPVMIGATYTNFVKRPAVFGWGTVVIVALCAVPVVAFLPELLQAGILLLSEMRVDGFLI